jgi:hypothetical protein
VVAKTPPTELHLLRTIYDRYYDTFANFSRDDPNRNRFTKNHVPLDIRAIARQLDVEPDLIFGTLYYILNEKHRIENTDWSRELDEPKAEVPFFMHMWPPQIAATLPEKFRTERDIVHFPMLASVYATLGDQDAKSRWAIGIAFGSFLVSCAALIVSCSK